MRKKRVLTVDARFGHELAEVSFEHGDVIIVLMRGAIRKNIAIDGSLFRLIVRSVKSEVDSFRRSADRLQAIIEGRDAQ